MDTVDLVELEKRVKELKMEAIEKDLFGKGDVIALYLGSEMPRDHNYETTLFASGPLEIKRVYHSGSENCSLTVTYEGEKRFVGDTQRRREECVFVEAYIPGEEWETEFEELSIAAYAMASAQEAKKARQRTEGRIAEIKANFGL